MRDYPLAMRLLPGTYCVAKLDGPAAWADAALRGNTARIAARIITPWDDTIICPDELVPRSHETTQRGFRALAVEGTLDFTLTGIISRISAALAGQEISVFVISTYDTDCVLVPGSRLQDAIATLREEGIAVSERTIK